jgi:hypothetical protein
VFVCLTAKINLIFNISLNGFISQERRSSHMFMGNILKSSGKIHKRAGKCD